MPITVDASRRPIVVVRFVGETTDAEFDAYLRTMDAELLARREPTVTILDASNAGRPSPSQRKKQSEWLRRHEDTLRRHALGTVLVVRSALVRAAMTAIFWVAPVHGPHTVVETLEEAEVWARERARAAGL